MPLSQFDESLPLNLGRTYLPADGTTVVQLLTATEKGYRIDEILLTSTAIVNHTVIFYLTLGAAIYAMGAVSVPAGSGFDPPTPVFAAAVIAPVNPAGWVLEAGYGLAAQMSAAIAAGKQVTVTIWGGRL